MAPKTQRKPSAAVVAAASSSSSHSPSKAAPSTNTSSSSTSTSKLAASSSNAVSQLWDAYLDTTPARLKLIDLFLVFTMLSGISVFAYCVLVTDFPLNAFLGAFASCVGQFVLLASLRSQVNPDNKITFPNVSPERAFADFTFASIILHFFSFNFLG